MDANMQLHARMFTLGYAVSAFIGLILLAIVLLVVGISMLVGVEHLRIWIAQLRSSSSTDGDKTPTATTAASTPKSAMRPYKIAKAKHQSGDDKILGLLLIMASLAMLWVLPSYFFQRRTSNTNDDPLYHGGGRTAFEEGEYTRKDRNVNSQASQGLLGALALVVLLVAFALLQPSKKSASSASQAAASSRTSSSNEHAGRTSTSSTTVSRDADAPRSGLRARNPRTAAAAFVKKS